MSFNNTSESKERGIATTTIKVAAKWMKKNSSKIANVLKKYLKINIVLPFQGDFFVSVLKPRAMPWARSFCPFRAYWL